jgi:hypothetical protein
MKPFKKRFDFQFLWFHLRGTISTHKWGWKKKQKPPIVQQETIPGVFEMSK